MQRGWDILVVDNVYFYVVRPSDHPGAEGLMGLDLTYADAERVMYRMRDLTR
jgi:hypothetical protein